MRETCKVFGETVELEPNTVSVFIQTTGDETVAEVIWPSVPCIDTTGGGAVLSGGGIVCSSAREAIDKVFGVCTDYGIKNIARLIQRLRCLFR